MSEDQMQADADQAAARTIQGLDTFFGETSTSAVFSVPEAHGDSAIITAASWERAGGFGFGGGAGTAGDRGGGGGGGGTSVGRPVAVVRVHPEGIEVEPVVDFTKLAVTALLSALGVWRALRS